jgi:hypothetical protein
VFIISETVSMEPDGKTLVGGIRITNYGTVSASFTVPYIIVTP